MKWCCPYLNVEYKVKSLEWWVLVHSYLYYELDHNIVLDKVFDDNAKQLVNLREQLSDEEVEYDYAFDGFDGTTGFDLYSRLNKEHKKRVRIASNKLRDKKWR